MATTLFNDSELSNWLGRPVNLYKFKRGDINMLYAESDRDVTIGNDTYSAANISDDGVALTGNATQDTLAIHMPTSSPLVQLYKGTAPSVTVYITVLRYHPGDADAIVSYVGQVMQVSQKSPGMAEVSCVSLSSTFRRDGLRIAWERGCPYALYDMCCTVDKSLYEVTGSVTNIYGNSLTVPAAGLKPDNWYSGGFVEWNIDPETVERRGIQVHIGQGLEIFGQGDGFYIGQALSLYPGCGRNVTDCQTKFNNFVNYGGIPMLPGKSPFDGDPVF